jgi:lytic murein transglycosylase
MNATDRDMGRGGRLDRRSLLLGAVLAVAAPQALAKASVPTPATDAATTAIFRAFVDGFRSDAIGHGIRGDLYDATFAGMALDPSVAAMTRRQPEFVKPLGAYFQAQVTPGRIAAGHALLDRWGAVLATIERTYRVPGAILVAVWGMETGYGAFPGNKDVIRSMATLAAIGVRADLYRAELVAALTLLQSGAVPRDRLRGSWAGAMGQPQFMPSSFQAYAVDGDGDGKTDIWTSVPDTLASIANFLAKQGWQAGRPWGFAATLPAGFDPRISQGRARDWAARGLVRADGAAMPTEGDFTLFFPAGASGPAFLVTPNFEVLKVYNMSDAYVLSTAAIADRMEGAPSLAFKWPSDTPMGREARIALQARLVALGYAVDDRQGRISLALRDVIRAAQASVGMVADGNPTDALLAALRTAPPAR